MAKRAVLLIVVAGLVACDDPAPDVAPTSRPTTTSTASAARPPATAIAPRADDCVVVIDTIGQVIEHPDTAEAINVEPGTVDEPATREAFDAVSARFGLLELRDPTVAAAAALVADRAGAIATVEGPAVELIESYSAAFLALSDLCATVVDAPAPSTAPPTG